MPGRNQLKQFNSDMLNLGDEVKVRAARGEKPVTVSIPPDVQDRDDSEDFISGMPQLSDAEIAAMNDTSDQVPDVSSLFSENALDSDDIDLSEFEEQGKTEPDFSEDVAGLSSPNSINMNDGIPAEFNEIPDEPPLETNNTDVQDLFGSFDDSQESTEDTALPPLDDFDLSNFENSEDAQTDNFQEEQIEEPENTAEESGSEEDFSSPEEFALPEEFDNFSETISPEENQDDEQIIADSSENSEDAQADNFQEEQIEESENTAEESGNGEEFSLPEEFDNFEESPTEQSENLSENFPVDEGEQNDSFEAQSEDGVEEENFSQANEEDSSAEENQDFNTEGLDGFDNIDLGDLDNFSFDENEESPQNEEESENQEDAQIDDNIFSADIDNENPMENLPNLEAVPPMDFSEESVPDDELDSFDTSAMDNVNFSDENDTDFELGDVSFSEDDDEDYSIPGFSGDIQGTQKPDVARPDFKDAITEDGRPKNTFTDTEYKQFLKNLADYPLNVRIALEDMVVKNEFTDDAVFEILEKVLRKVPARQLAAELEKMLDISLSVPRDFERRSATEYEAYKQSMEYQLKNRIIPGAILTAAAAVLIMILWFAGRTFIYNPLKASSLYKEGYALIQKDQYPQSLDKFNEAQIYRKVKKWFFNYARSYREHKQYERARTMYKAILDRYKHDKTAGLEWASMELYDLYNYEEAERILKREVLDYHINDSDAILALGDLYLEWATNADSSKYALAKEQYDLLLELYGGNSSALDTYYARQMRYYIRTDSLSQVLNYKNYFYPKKLKNLSAQDTTELSGYLMDKRFGLLSPAEEKLRSDIENVRDLLEKAVEKDQTNPVALYNMGRYFIFTNNDSYAISLLKNTISAFENQTYRNHRDTYKYINTFRLLGEIYKSQKEYILAETTYGDGIDLYEAEFASSGFASDENIGKLYADLGDIYYFVSGELDSALTQYQKAVDNKNDTSSVRYKIGYIQYLSSNYSEALGSFIRSLDNNPTDTHLLLALANTLSLRNDNYAAEGYYKKLLSILDNEFTLHDVLLPQVREDQGDLVDTYMKATNNLGVTLSRIASSTGDSKANAQSIVNLQNSLRAWDALTRNQTTMVRLEGSNLAEQNIKYITNPNLGYESEIYTQIPKSMLGEKGLE